MFKSHTRPLSDTNNKVNMLRKVYGYYGFGFGYSDVYGKGYGDGYIDGNGNGEIKELIFIRKKVVAIKKIV